MKSVKCNNCGLSNFESVGACRRCGNTFAVTLKKKTDGRRPGRFSLISLIVYAVLGAGGYFLYTAVHRSFEDVNANDAYRVGTQPAQKTPELGLTRNEADRKQANQVGTMLNDNPSIAAQKQHNEETQKLMQQVSR